jgi:hypothetical protein
MKEETIVQTGLILTFRQAWKRLRKKRDIPLSAYLIVGGKQAGAPDEYGATQPMERLAAPPCSADRAGGSSCHFCRPSTVMHFCGLGKCFWPGSV